MIKAVLDTNGFVSAAIKPGGLQHQIYQAWRHDEFELATSEEIIAEIERVLEYPRIKRVLGLTPQEIREMIRTLRENAEITPGRIQVDIVKDDPDDNKFLACAEEAGASFVVTGDDHLLKLGSYKGIQIVTGRRFFRRLQEAQEHRD